MNDIEKMRYRTKMNSVLMLKACIEGLKDIPVIQIQKEQPGKFDDIRSMTRQELLTFIRTKETKDACKSVYHNKYTPNECLIASRSLYAQNRVRLLS